MEMKWRNLFTQLKSTEEDFCWTARCLTSRADINSVAWSGVINSWLGIRQVTRILRLKNGEVTALMCAARHGRIEAGVESDKRVHILFNLLCFELPELRSDMIWCMYNAVAGTRASSSCSSRQQVVQLLLESSADPVWCWTYRFEDIFLTGIGQHFFLLTRETVARKVRTDMLGRTALVRSLGLDEASHPLPITSLNFNFLSRSHEEEVLWPRDKQWVLVQEPRIMLGVSLLMCKSGLGTQNCMKAHIAHLPS